MYSGNGKGSLRVTDKAPVWGVGGAVMSSGWLHMGR